MIRKYVGTAIAPEHPVAQAAEPLGTLAGVNPVDLSLAFVGVEVMQHLCHELSVHSGWWAGVDPKNNYVFGTKLALVHSEVSEALEGGRKDTMDSHLSHRKSEEVELADAVIRIFDLAGARGLDLAGAIVEKLAYNQQRADHKPENREQDGGKKF